MVKVRFIARVPGKHRTIGDYEMGAVPRVGEIVTINEVSGMVHTVAWEVTADWCLAHVLLEVA